jgi:hypothetical protein
MGARHAGHVTFVQAQAYEVKLTRLLFDRLPATVAALDSMPGRP